MTHEVEGKTHTYNYQITQNNQVEGVESKAYTYDKISSLQTDGTKRLDWTGYGKLAEVSNVLKNTQFF